MGKPIIFYLLCKIKARHFSFSSTFSSSFFFCFFLHPLLLLPLTRLLILILLLFIFHLPLFLLSSSGIKQYSSVAFWICWFQIAQRVVWRSVMHDFMHLAYFPRNTSIYPFYVLRILSLKNCFAFKRIFKIFLIPRTRLFRSCYAWYLMNAIIIFLVIKLPHTSPLRYLLTSYFVGGRPTT